MRKLKETDLGKVVVAHLRDYGWEVYQEVQLHGAVCDVVGTKGNLIWAVEVKKSLSFDLIAQAESWTRYAHLVSVAAPMTKNEIGRRGIDRGRELAKRVLEERGIGFLAIEVPARGDPLIRPYRSSQGRLHRRVLSDQFRNALREEQKTYTEAGTRGGYFTLFKKTRMDLIAHVARNPGCSIKEAVDAVDHHYTTDRSARGSLVNLIHRGVIPEVMTFQSNREILLYPAGKAPVESAK